ncbi:hypothetical protein P879_02538 [Paragonimus westermani]|uniref:Protein PTHB1 n=1 Tax=Paragonimus westermani TaxID=34504 RepID=A0A8T0DSP1_9TREM|nr:hypothetical protein P879_02538 [Paragonimus westermani]
MSLFNIKDFWETNVSKLCPDVDDCDLLCVDNIFDNESDSYQLIHASRKGTLSVFAPFEKVETVSSGEVDYADMSLEFSTNEPVIGLLTGNFSPEHFTLNCLAVLHSSKLSVYASIKSLVNQQNIAKFIRPTTDQYLEVCYTIPFKKSMYNMCCGKFSRGENHLRICVQSLDCSLFIYSGVNLIYSLRLVDVLLPGPLLFLNCTVEFLTVSTSRQLVSFKADEKFGTLVPDALEEYPPKITWNYLFSEPVFQLGILEYGDTLESCFPQAFVLAIGRHNITLLSEDGRFLGTRRLEMIPRLFCIYGLTQSIVPVITYPGLPALSWEPRFCIATEEKHLLVFKGLQIIWSAQLPECPVCMAMPPITFESTSENPPRIGRNIPPGLIALLTAGGKLSLSYLGTNPDAAIVRMPVEATQLDSGGKEEQQKLYKELLELQLKIETLSETRLPILEKSDSITPPLDSHSNPIRIQAKLQAAPHSVSLTDTQANHSLEVSLLFPKNSQASDFLPIAVNVSACAPIQVNPNHWQLVSTDLHESNAFSRSRDNKLSFTLSIDFDTTSPLMSIPPLDFAIHLIASYVTSSADSSKVTQFIETGVRIPLSWVFSGFTCRKRDMAGLFTLNFALSHAYIPKMVRLKHLLPTVWPANHTESTVCLKLRLPDQTEWQNQPPSSHIYVSQNYGKHHLCLQSSSAELFWPVLQELYAGLVKLVTAQNLSRLTEPLLLLLSTESVDIADQSSSPIGSVDQLSPFFDYLRKQLDDHLESRIALATRAAATAVQSRHFRAIQRHVLNRIRENVPVPLNGFDALLEVSLHSLIRCCDMAMSNTRQQLVTGASVISLVTLLSFISVNCTKGDCDKPVALAHVGYGLFWPGQLMSIIEATEHLEINRGCTALPDSRSNNSDMDESPIESHQVGLEECLDLAISRIWNTLDLDETDKFSMPTINFSTATIPDVRELVQHLKQLCDKLPLVNIKYLTNLVPQFSNVQSVKKN